MTPGFASEAGDTNFVVQVKQYLSRIELNNVNFMKRVKVSDYDVRNN